MKEFDNKLQSEFKRIENYFDRDLYLIKKQQASILNKRITSDKLMNNKVEWMPKRSETSTISYESGFKHHRQTNENESPKDRIKKSIINLLEIKESNKNTKLNPELENKINFTKFSNEPPHHELQNFINANRSISPSKTLPQSIKSNILLQNKINEYIIK